MFPCVNKKKYRIRPGARAGYIRVRARRLESFFMRRTLQHLFKSLNLIGRQRSRIQYYNNMNIIYLRRDVDRVYGRGG